MNSEKRQYSRLTRSFAGRFLDNELIAPGGDGQQSAVHALALLGALGVVCAYLLFEKYFFMQAGISAATREATLWNDRTFLISLSMALTGFAAVLSWDSMFPDKRDCLTLSALPIRMRTFFAAKLTAISGAFALVIIASNAATTLVFPAATLTRSDGLMALAQHYFAHVVAIGSASAFVFFTFLGLQALLITTISARTSRRLSAYVQLIAFFGIILGFFLLPPVMDPQRLTDPANRNIVTALPPFWFLGLYQYLLGSGQPVVHQLASISMIGLCSSAALSLLLYTAGYARYVRRTIEESGMVSIRSNRGRDLLARVIRSVVRDHRQRAVFLFVWRTMARNRMHRMLLAIYAGVGIAYVLVGLASVFKPGGQSLQRVSVEMSAAPIILPFFLLLGMRFLFAIPVELRANWIFRITEDAPVGAYLPGVEKLMLWVGVLPVSILSLPVYGLLWNWETAIRHCVMSLLISLISIELLMGRFPKIPFTCALLPGRANLKVKFGAYLGVFFGFSRFVLIMEIDWAQRTRPTVIAATIALAFLIWLKLRHRRDRPGSGAVIYEEKPEWAPTVLELRT